MAVLPIVKYPASVLRKKATDVPREAIILHHYFIQDMIDTMKANEGIGLASPQVGNSEQIILASYKTGIDPMVLINPRISSVDGPTETMVEGCLSFPYLQVAVTRPKDFVVHYLDEKGKEHRKIVGGLLGRVILHEIDHLDGKLLIDRLPFWQRLKYRYARR